MTIKKTLLSSGTVLTVGSAAVMTPCRPNSLARREYIAKLRYSMICRTARSGATPGSDGPTDNCGVERCGIVVSVANLAIWTRLRRMK